MTAAQVNHVRKPGRPAELLAILPHDRGRFETDADPSALVDIGALGGKFAGRHPRGSISAAFCGHSERYISKPNAIFGVKRF
jgi:hypothetical protein